MKALASVVGLFMVCLSVLSAQAQTVYTWMSPIPEVSGAFGFSVSGSGDTNIDGYADLAVGACFEDGGASDAGRAYIFNGQTGGPIRILVSPKLNSPVTSVSRYREQEK